MRNCRIIATLGPATSTEPVLKDLIAAGLDIVRLNMSHAKTDWVREMVPLIRRLASNAQKTVSILMDLQGPAIRTGEVSQPRPLEVGQTVVLSADPARQLAAGDLIWVNYPHLAEDVKPGGLLMVDNGLIEFKVVQCQGYEVTCEVVVGGTLGSRRHINLPGVEVRLPGLTEKDKADIALGVELKLDFIALSFVREAGHLRELRGLLPSTSAPKIVAKIEDQQAVKNLADIIKESDAVMVARGDLGMEVPFEQLPIIQRRIVTQCFQQGRPVIVATHMLESMIQSPSPTRAEVTDIANAIFEQADAIMLSGETSVGKFPRRCIEIMDRVARRMESEPTAQLSGVAQLTSDRQRLARQAVNLANEINAEALVVFARSGKMARCISWMRPRRTRIVVVCQTEEQARGLHLCWGVFPVVLPHLEDSFENIFSAAIEQAKCRGWIEGARPKVIVRFHESPHGQVDAIEVR